MTLPLAAELFHRRDFMAALELLEQIDTPVAHYNAGQACVELGRYPEAANHFRSAVVAAPRNATAWMKLGSACHMAQDHDAAVIALEKALELAPEDAEVNHAFASLMATFLLDLKAIRHYQHAQMLRPGYVEPAIGEAFCLLRRGLYPAGWEKFEARWGLEPGSETYFGLPEWDGEHRGRVVVRTEQGFGDSLQLMRYIPLMAERVVEVVVEAHPLLRRVFENLPGVAWVIDKGATPPTADAQISLMSLPRIFGTTVATIPPPVVPEMPEAIGLPGAFKIGLCWRGGTRADEPQAHAVDNRRSVAFKAFMPFLSIPGATFVSLQKEGGDEAANSRVLTQYISRAADFYDTLAIIAGLDVVVTVDTAVAHLAATVGKKVLLLNRFDTCWRWMLSRIDTPWYPSMRIVRQRKLGDWSHPIAQVEADLRVMATRAGAIR